MMTRIVQQTKKWLKFAALMAAVLPGETGFLAAAPFESPETQSSAAKRGAPQAGTVLLSDEPVFPGTSGGPATAAANPRLALRSKQYGNEIPEGIGQELPGEIAGDYSPATQGYATENAPVADSGYAPAEGYVPAEGYSQAEGSGPVDGYAAADGGNLFSGNGEPLIYDGAYGGSYQDGEGSACGPDGCGKPGCDGGCCNSPGLLQLLHNNKCNFWTGRVELLTLWRSSPQARPLYNFNPLGDVALNANAIQSDPAIGPRFSVFRTDSCGNGIEATYFQGANFRGQAALPTVSEAYKVASPIYGNTPVVVNTASANLGSAIRSFELNDRVALGSNVQFLAGFRWLEWRESIQIYDTPFANPDKQDIYSTNCMNDLYGGQIGLDASLLKIANVRTEAFVKAGAYYNNAYQASSYQYSDVNQSIRVGGSACSFVGEVGMTGVLPLTENLDFRFGYLALWLTGLAQPTNQLSGQTLVQATPTSGSLNTVGGVVVQGLTLGLEGRW